MRFSSAIVLTVVAALASSISATPIDASTGDCPVFCVHTRECATCPARKVAFLCLVSPSRLHSHR
ncbi:hypothetical protein CY34DRAFT_811174 [Suillus luteus UH-Slu-Lm8-n1]|uniref:Uncharacterized protein n=1 Tax=Suillus luteus UH-Slu-Lm8-n1 TaxID=930992 RepID=A0A0D0AXK5_9AGAM|nr:hypothetical protein CY34DRAFT_811174 [Suillus luteus UH-Slu-Lm8-n1]